ncbi:hypothetical protein VTK73DRAFT_3057 [Phialemonium thermophilum]|uniref:Uncharacterized protein n=1 Tax=Phialemonium thermophilum TaxID=223376 RepID=A0ABR3X1X8_9PEZI
MSAASEARHLPLTNPSWSIPGRAVHILTSPHRLVGYSLMMEPSQGGRYRCRRGHMPTSNSEASRSGIPVVDVHVPPWLSYIRFSHLKSTEPQGTCSKSCPCDTVRLFPSQQSHHSKSIPPKTYTKRHDLNSQTCSRPGTMGDADTVDLNTPYPSSLRAHALGNVSWSLPSSPGPSSCRT